MNRIIRIIFNILFILIIVILSLYLVLKHTNNISIYKVVTGSMETNIHAGDYIIVKKSTNYKEGDVVTYKKDGHYITHRVVKVNDKTVITKGDANNVDDGEISKNDIVGKYIFKSKVMNFIINNKYILITILIILFISGELIIRYKK